jgi:hypothetical protein
MVPADQPQARAQQPSAAELGLDLTLSIVDDRAQHVMGKHWILLVCRLVPTA